MHNEIKLKVSVSKYEQKFIDLGKKSSRIKSKLLFRKFKELLYT